ncbi:MAG TPA: VWA domain-containing protein [Terriglobales bacterium]|jgi:VWFA-related protein|nr:VWA domain-containing protein [Terriglobales bacterium]
MGCFFVRLFLVLWLMLCTVSAQNNAPPQLQPRPGGQPLPTPSRQITLDVRVTDKSGAPVLGLQKQDFAVLDDKQSKAIQSFVAVDNATSGTPVEIVVVIDAVNTSFTAVTYERTELKKFLLQNGGKLAQPVSLVVFSDNGTKMQDGSSRDGNALASLYDQYETGLRFLNRSQGVYGAAERFDMSIRTLMSLVSYEEKRPGRKLMIWFSPGWPMLSGPNIQLSSKDEREIFNSIVAASTGLRQARITLYSLDPHGPEEAGGIRVSYYEEFLKGISSPSHALPGDLALQVLAVQSGGRVFNSSNDLTGAIDNSVSDANAFYTLSFESAKPDRADEYHALQVTIDKPGTTVRTRTGYYAEP